MSQKGYVQFRIVLVVVILTIVALMSGATVLSILTVAREASNQTARALFAAATESARTKLDTVLGDVGIVANSAAAVDNLAGAPRDNGLEHPALEFFENNLRAFPWLYSVYVGYEDGRFFQLIDVSGDDQILAAHQAPDETRFIARTIVGFDADRVEHWSYLDSDGETLGFAQVREPEYDPRVRPWYQSASWTAASLSDPYVFSSLQEPGITASRTLIDGGGVFGADITLSELQNYVDANLAIPGGGLLIVDSQDRVVAAAEAAMAVLDLDQMSQPLSDVPTSVVDLADGFNRVSEIDLLATSQPHDVFGDRTWQVIAVASLDAFSRPFDLLRRRVYILTIVFILISLPIALHLSSSMTRMLTLLAADADRVGRLEFVEMVMPETRVREFRQLATGFSVMKQTLAARSAALNDTLSQLETLIEISIAISAEQNIDTLSELILRGAQQLSMADAGSLYLVDETRTLLDFQIVLTDSLGFAQGGTSGNAVTLPSVRLYSDNKEPNHHNVVSSCFHTGHSVVIDDAYNATGFDFSGTREFDRANGYRSQSFLTVPLKPRGAPIIGAMQLLNSIDPETGEIIPFTPEARRMVEALASGAATALRNRDLLSVQKRLFDALIQLIAGAIDAKSPYTSAHCARVPKIAFMLAEEADKNSDGPFAEFSMGNEDNWRAFYLGTWLHDAGKVTTPDHVVDKATKLETLYDRIHEVRTRFEVLLRDAKIEMYEQIASGTPENDAEEAYRRTAAELQDDFTFLADCNLGGESLSDKQRDRIREIGDRRWLRHFDDRIGVSWVELSRYPDGDRAHTDSPIEETLLADKPQHRVPREKDRTRAYQALGFVSDYPDDQYNRGEIHNLTIDRGTLTPEERFKINEHVMQTIVMLDGLPLPDELANVVDYAGTHHEALDGSGYPRGLTRDDLSIPARITAIADIFEALTAFDRPYKRAKPLSVAVDILHRFKLDNHIDGDLFDLFLTSGIYRRYAEEHLKPEQIDEVDISKYVG